MVYVFSGAEPWLATWEAPAGLWSITVYIPKAGKSACTVQLTARESKFTTGSLTLHTEIPHWVDRVSAPHPHQVDSNTLIQPPANVSG